MSSAPSLPDAPGRCAASGSRDEPCRPTSSPDAAASLSPRSAGPPWTSRIQPLEEAVVALDQFLRAGLVTVDQLRAAAAAISGPGCRQIRRAADLADGLAESPQETRVRLLLNGSRLPRPTAQYTVRGPDGRFIARVDFAWPDAKVAVEYEGMWHGQAQQIGRDRRRLNELTAAGWTVEFVTAAELRDPVVLIARIAAALEARPYA